MVPVLNHHGNEGTRVRNHINGVFGDRDPVIIEDKLAVSDKQTFDLELHFHDYSNGIVLVNDLLGLLSLSDLVHEDVDEELVHFGVLGQQFWDHFAGMV